MTTSTRTWAVLLEGSRRDQAIDAALSVAKALATVDTEDNPTATEPTLNGCLGAVLLLTALGESVDDEYAVAARALFDDAVDRVMALDRPTPGLYGAPTGIGWVDTVVRARVGENEDAENDVD